MTRHFVCPAFWPRVRKSSVVVLTPSHYDARGLMVGWWDWSPSSGLAPKVVVLQRTLVCRFRCRLVSPSIHLSHHHHRLCSSRSIDHVREQSVLFSSSFLAFSDKMPNVTTRRKLWNVGCPADYRELAKPLEPPPRGLEWRRLEDDTWELKETETETEDRKGEGLADQG